MNKNIHDKKISTSSRRHNRVFFSRLNCFDCFPLFSSLVIFLLSVKSRGGNSETFWVRVVQINIFMRRWGPVWDLTFLDKKTVFSFW